MTRPASRILQRTLAILALAFLCAWTSALPVDADDNICQVDEQLLAAADSEGGLGGTGVHGEGDGLGGTGLRGSDEGLGGTGVFGGEEEGIGGTGILGTITRFGSICVNGLRVHYDADAAVKLQGRDSSTDALGIGQRVWVRAIRNEHGLVAESISIVAAAVGRVDGVETDTGRMLLAGTPIEFSEDSTFGEGLGPDTVAAAESVVAYGVHDADGTLLVTRIERAESDEGWRAPSLNDLLAADEAPTHLSVEGVVHRGPGGALEIEGLGLDGDGLEQALRVRSGERVWLSGRLEKDHRLRVKRVSRRAPRAGKRPGSFVRDRGNGSQGDETVRVSRRRTRQERGSADLVPTEGAPSLSDTRPAEPSEPGSEEIPVEPEPVAKAAAESNDGGAKADRKNARAKKQENKRAAKARRKARRAKATADRSASNSLARAETGARNRPETPPDASPPPRDARPQRIDRAKRPERLDRGERPERPRRKARLARPDRPARADLPRRAKRPERPERPPRPKRRNR